MDNIICAKDMEMFYFLGYRINQNDATAKKGYELNSTSC